MPLNHREELGEYLYLWRAEPLDKNTLVISAHGLQAISLSSPMKLGHPRVELQYFSLHNYTTVDEGLRMAGQRDPSEVLTPDSSPDYVLSKYTNSQIGPDNAKHNQAGETYESVNYAAGYENFDVLTVRHRYPGTPLAVTRLSTILQTLWREGHNYAVIKCYFCRGFFEAQ